MDEFTDPTGQILNLSFIETIDATQGVEGAAMRVVFRRTQLLGYWVARQEIQLMAWMSFTENFWINMDWRPSVSAIQEWWHDPVTPYYRRKYESIICGLFGTWIERLTNPIHIYG